MPEDLKTLLALPGRFLLVPFYPVNAYSNEVTATIASSSYGNLPGKTAFLGLRM